MLVPIQAAPVDCVETQDTYELLSDSTSKPEIGSLSRAVLTIDGLEVDLRGILYISSNILDDVLSYTIVKYSIPDCDYAVLKGIYVGKKQDIAIKRALCMRLT